MDNELKLRLVNVMRRLNHQGLEYGNNDCNLMVLEMFEPEIYKKFLGRYKTLIGGARVAKKEFGFGRLDDYLSQSKEYTQIPKPFITFGDIICSDVGRVVMISTSNNRAFAIDQNDIFRECTISIPDNYKIFRRGLWNQPQY